MTPDDRPLVGYRPEHAFVDFGWHGSHSIFHDLLDATCPNVVIEIGSYLGQSTIQMASWLEERDRGVLYAVDTWLGSLETLSEPHFQRQHGYPDLYWRFASNIVHMRLERRVAPLPMTSAAAARLLDNWGVRAELVYIDGSHLLEEVSADLRAFSRMLAPGGIIFGDDYTDLWPEVVEAVDIWRGQSPGVSVVRDGPFWIARGAAAS